MFIVENLVEKILNWSEISCCNLHLLSKDEKTACVTPET